MTNQAQQSWAGAAPIWDVTSVLDDREAGSSPWRCRGSELRVGEGRVIVIGYLESAPSGVHRLAVQRPLGQPVRLWPAGRAVSPTMASPSHSGCLRSRRQVTRRVEGHEARFLLLRGGQWAATTCGSRPVRGGYIVLTY